MKRRRSLKDILLQQEGITNEHISRIMEAQREKGLSLYQALCAVDSLNEEAVAAVMCEVSGRPYLDLKNYRIPEDMFLLMPVGIARSLKVVPLSRTSGMVTIALADPLNVISQDWVKEITRCNVTAVVGTASSIEYAAEHVGDNVVVEEKKPEEEIETIEELFQKLDSVSSVSSVSEADPQKTFAEAKALGEEEVIRLIDTMLHTAVIEGASDIHLEPYENIFRLRYRHDGRLKTVSEPPIAMYGALCSRIKIMSDLNIAEHRIPQDGRMKIKVDEKDIDFRVSILPTHHGEKVVMRVLDKKSVALNFKALGFDEYCKNQFVKAIEQPNGIVLVTGPTGSGKTTTLYAALSMLNVEDVNIVTVEDPIEYDFFSINQVQINSKVGLTFSSGLRSILRQDPDIVMVGEIRDGETADIAIRAALTGHLVLSTLHTNDAIGAIYRLIDMGVQPFMLASSLNMCQAQRLIRKLCSECKKPATQLPEEVIKVIKTFIPPDHQGPLAYEPQGCSNCGGTGYRGRTSLIEMLPVTDKIKEMIVQKESASKIRGEALKHGMKSLYRSGTEKMVAGTTSLEEVMRTAVV